MYRLYYRANTGRPARTRWALEEAGAPYEYVQLTPEQTAAELYRERHPMGRVPLLETDDGYLYESAALCLQIADAHPEAGLIPPVGTYERGQVYQWCFWGMVELEPRTVQVWRTARGVPGLTTPEELFRVVGVLERALEGREHLVGDGFTVADVVVGGTLAIGRRLDVLPLDDLPNVSAYLDRLDGREAKQRAYVAYLEELPAPRR